MEGVNMAEEQVPPAGADLAQGVALSDFSGETLLGHVGDHGLGVRRLGERPQLQSKTLVISLPLPVTARGYRRRYGSFTATVRSVSRGACIGDGAVLDG